MVAKLLRMTDSNMEACGKCGSIAYGDECQCVVCGVMFDCNDPVDTPDHEVFAINDVYNGKV